MRFYCCNENARGEGGGGGGGTYCKSNFFLAPTGIHFSLLPALTQVLPYLTAVVQLQVLVLGEEIPIHFLSPKQEDVAIVSDGSLGKLAGFQSSALSLGLARGRHIRQSKQAEEVLHPHRGKTKASAYSEMFLSDPSGLTTG